jgi:uncharacterized protein (TIGR02466 family)
MTEEYIQDTPDIEPIDLWQTSCFLTTNPFHDLLKDELKKVIYADIETSEQSVKSEVAVTAKLNLAESELDFLENQDANVQSLNVYLTDLITTVATEMNQGFWPEGADAQAGLTESWYHVTKNGGYHDAHSHPNCSWCGIYYVDIGEANFQQRNGLNRFYDPRLNADQYLDAGSQYLNSTGIWDIEPVDGQVIIFPSYLKHSALPYFGKKDRIVIAFNARIDLI